jgi:hypothetical protein
MKKRSIDYGGVKGNQMKRLCTVIMVSFTITLYATSWSFGQGSTKRTTKSPESLDLMSLDVIDVLKVEAALMGTSWELAVGSQEDAPKSNRGALEDFSKSLNEKYETKERTWGLKYEKNVRKILGNLELIGDDWGRFVCSSTLTPVRFAQKGDGIVFLVTKVFSDNVYNTLRTTAKTRASNIISSMILPSMKAFYNSFGSTDIKYYGMVVAYGSKDFSKEGNVLNLRAEVVSLIVSAQTCKKFVEGIITDDELINASEIYLQDRDVKHLKRIKVNLE